jgi:hypothetical protein
LGRLPKLVPVRRLRSAKAEARLPSIVSGTTDTNPILSEWKRESSGMGFLCLVWHGRKARGSKEHGEVGVNPMWPEGWRVRE